VTDLFKMIFKFSRMAGCAYEFARIALERVLVNPPVRMRRKDVRFSLSTRITVD